MTLAVERNQVAVTCIDEEIVPKYRIGEKVLLVDEFLSWEQWRGSVVCGVQLLAQELVYGVKVSGVVKWLGEEEICRPHEAPHFHFDYSEMF